MASLPPMSANHKAQVQAAKADFVKKLTMWINATTKDLENQSEYRRVEAGLMQRILDVHAVREKTTQNVYVEAVNCYFIPHIKEEIFMRLRQINMRDTYVEILFNYLWKKKVLTQMKAETKEMIDIWFENPRYQKKFPYSLFLTGMRGNSFQKEQRYEQPRYEKEPEQETPDSWDDEVEPINLTPAEEFAALAKEFGVPFQQGDSIDAAYRKLALLMHPDKHPAEETDTWTVRMKSLNALRVIVH